MTFSTLLPLESPSTPSPCPGPAGLRVLWWQQRASDLQHLVLRGELSSSPALLPTRPLWLARGPQVRAAGRRWAAAYLGRTGPGAAERRRARRGARGRAHPGRARGTARGGGCGAPARSCQALQPSAGLATPASVRDRARRRAMSSRLRLLLRASPRPRGHRLQGPGSAPGTLAPHAC